MKRILCQINKKKKINPILKIYIYAKKVDVKNI